MLELIEPTKDADGLHPTNLGRLVLNVHGPIDVAVPCTPRGIVELLLRHGIDLRGSRRAASWAAASPSGVRSGCCSPAARSTRP